MGINLLDHGFQGFFWSDRDPFSHGLFGILTALRRFKHFFQKEMTCLGGSIPAIASALSTSQDEESREHKMEKRLKSKPWGKSWKETNMFSSQVFSSSLL